MADLFNFELRSSGDPAKIDLELTCVTCGEHLCDAEDSDALYALVSVSESHAGKTGHGA